MPRDGLKCDTQSRRHPLPRGPGGSRRGPSLAPRGAGLQQGGEHMTQVR